MTEKLKNTNIGLLEYVLTEMEDQSKEWNINRAWFLLLLGTAKLDVLNVKSEDVDSLVEFLAHNDGGSSEDYYDIWKDIVDHAKVGEL
jgi:hypothetical protein